MERFMALGVVEETSRRPMSELNAFFEKPRRLFAKEDFTKAQVVEAIEEFIPNFEHEEKGKNLDQKMKDSASGRISVCSMNKKARTLCGYKASAVLMEVHLYTKIALF